MADNRGRGYEARAISPGPGQPDALFVIAIDNGRRRQLTFPQGLVADLDPAMSLDGRALIFRRDTTPFSGTLFCLPLNSGRREPGTDEPPEPSAHVASDRHAAEQPAMCSDR